MRSATVLRLDHVITSPATDSVYGNSNVRVSLYEGPRQLMLNRFMWLIASEEICLK